MSQKRSHSPTTEPKHSQLYRSTSITDRSSTFTALFSPTLPIKTVQTDLSFKKADHRITAWRKASSQRTLSTTNKVLYTTGSDDDGEKYAGKKLEKVLIEADVEGSLVVARWYGGILLGPVRFTHIENVAKQAIASWKAEVGGERGAASKRLKPEPNAVVEVDRDALIATLRERDTSIRVLRELLAEKRALAGLEVEASSQTQSAKVIEPKYAEMEVVLLKRLEKIRDATIRSVLDAIDRAEEEIQKQLELADLDEGEDVVGGDDSLEQKRVEERVDGKTEDSQKEELLQNDKNGDETNGLISN